MSVFKLLHELPEELLQDVIERLDVNVLSSLSLVSRWCYDAVTPLLWRDVTLTDCRTHHEDATDEHDDTPFIRKLLILATKPDIASHVQTLTHRCHLPPPEIYNELPASTFSSQTLSTDPRTIRLVFLAVQHMTKVSTLRIIFGHPTLSDTLLRCFFDKHRPNLVPVRKLWLENVRISAGCCLSLDEQPYDLPLQLDFDGLESARFRRLPLRGGRSYDGFLSDRLPVHARSAATHEWHDSAGGQYTTTVNKHSFEQLAGYEQELWRTTHNRPRGEGSEGGVGADTVSPLERLYEPANRFDDRIYDDLAAQINLDFLQSYHVPSHLERSELAFRGAWLDPLDLEQCSVSAVQRSQREKLPSFDVALGLLQSASRTLTSLTLDWVFTHPLSSNDSVANGEEWRWTNMFIHLFSLRFPMLRAFQLRNSIVLEAQLPPWMSLLDSSTPFPTHSFHSALQQGQLPELETTCLDFMEAHPKIQCLAWPVDQFFSATPSSTHIAMRAQAVIDNLARTLIDLRVDTRYAGVSDRQTESVRSPNPSRRERRRRFIEQFAAKMTRVESIKMEGGLPRDERREIIRALHACPLQKCVMIGTDYPLGNTWGTAGVDMVEPLSHDELEGLEGEDKDAIWRDGMRRPEPVSPDFVFDAVYGWPSGPPLIHTLASFHARTITELKFCGYKGAPILLSPTRITLPLLAALKHFHNLKSLVLSLWLSTFFEDAPRDSEIIAYWLNARSPASTALVLVSDAEPEGWQKELLEKYAPAALARRITEFVGPLLSEEAKASKGGVHVRASFCIGDWAGIFDVDLVIGKDAMGSDVCLGSDGPREEFEPHRRRSKLEGRRWF